MCNLEEFPEEIMVKVFRYLPLSHLHNSVANVCRKWNRISQDNLLHRYLHVDQKLRLQKIIRLLKRYSTVVQKLSINERCDTDEILKVVPQCHSLRCLTINSCCSSSSSRGQTLSDVDATLISRILENNSNLIRLRITYSTIGNGKIKIGRHNLEELVFKNTYYDRGGIEENELLTRNTIRILNLQGLIINIPYLFKIISHNSESLRTVKLDVWAPQLDSSDQIFGALSACANLEKLFLRNVSFYINVDKLQPLAALKNLTAIELSEFEKVIPHNFARFFEKPQSKLLKKIILRNCDGVEGSVVRAIADNCSELNWFGINQFKIADTNLIKSEDILYLAAKCGRLETLDLCYTHASVGKLLPQIVSYLPFLKKFLYCDYRNDDSSKILLTSIYNILIRNLKNFSIELQRNGIFDQVLCGIRNEIF